METTLFWMVLAMAALGLTQVINDRRLDRANVTMEALKHDLLQIGSAIAALAEDAGWQVEVTEMGVANVKRCPKKESDNG